MPIENAQFIAGLNPSWPLGSDGVNTSDDHHRLTKLATQQSFPLIDAVVNTTPADLNLLAGAAALGSGLNPVGAVIAGAWAAAPNGYLYCDGSAIDPQYTALIALVGANTPDLRGQFLRGISDSPVVDPDGPRAALSPQADDFAAHAHNTDRVNTGNTTGQGTSWASNTNPTYLQDRASESVGGAETRPVNVAFMFVIKW